MEVKQRTRGQQARQREQNVLRDGSTRQGIGGTERRLEEEVAGGTSWDGEALGQIKIRPPDTRPALKKSRSQASFWIY